jgi:REP element-mobilizing transposase RayT
MCHGVFSTKNRRPILRTEIIPELTRVVGGILRKRDGKLLALNGTADHVHLLAIFHPKHALADLFRDIKCVSSDWIHDTIRGMGEFAWQSGYSVFSVSKSKASEVEGYIARQRTHHQRRTFEDELIALLERHGIEYDPRYVFD